ncbi:hypothetical protein MRX96_038876 [Rhipicephalus microplus]|nr:leucine-rich repeat extensin-like protein 2 [Rhipicephalus microplus]
MIPPHLSQSSCGTSAGAATSANNGTVALSDSQTRQKRGNATSDLQESGVDTSSELPFGAVKHRVWSPVSLCCGFDIRQPFMEPQVEQSPDFQDIAVYTSGSFPCLHIALRGLRPDHAYYLAIDFEEVMAGDEDKWAPQYADPYFIPRPNHRYGARWMKETLYFNLKTIVNGYLEIYGCKLRERGEHLPVLRVHEYCPNLNHLICSVTRIKLPSWAFVITFKRKPSTDPNTKEQEIHLALKKDQFNSPPPVVLDILMVGVAPQPPATLSDSTGQSGHVQYRSSTLTPPPVSQYLQNYPVMVRNSPLPTFDFIRHPQELAATLTTEPFNNAYTPEREIPEALKADQFSSPPPVVEAQLTVAVAPLPSAMLCDSSSQPVHDRYHLPTPTPALASNSLQNYPAMAANPPPPTFDYIRHPQQLAAAQTTVPSADAYMPEREIHLAWQADQVSSAPPVVQARFTVAMAPHPPATLSDSSGQPTHCRYYSSTPTPTPASQYIQNYPAVVPNSLPPNLHYSRHPQQLVASQATEAPPQEGAVAMCVTEAPAPCLSSSNSLSQWSSSPQQPGPPRMSLCCQMAMTIGSPYCPRCQIFLHY